MSDRMLATPVERRALAEHYRQVEAFQISRARTAGRISTALAVLSALAILLNIVLAVALVALLPLKQVVPVYLWVRNDGTVDSSVAMSRLPPTTQKAVIDAALWEYVRLREGYTFDTAQYAYDIVSQLSAPTVRTGYQSFFNYPNPKSPQLVIGRKGTMSVEHVSTSDLSPSIQQIRFRRLVAMNDGASATTTWTATIQYALVTDLPAQQRLSNPGGVVVTSYEASEDTAR